MSNIVIQIFKPAISNNFQEATTVLNTRQWDIVPSISFLTVLGCSPLVHSTKEKCESLTLDSKDVNLFKQLRNMGTRLNDALKLSRKGKGLRLRSFYKLITSYEHVSYRKCHAILCATEFLSNLRAIFCRKSRLAPLIQTNFRKNRG